MSQFDFKKYHVRAMNASNELEKEVINKELKDLYASLSGSEKKEFNRQLESFLLKETESINSVLNQ